VKSPASTVCRSYERSPAAPVPSCPTELLPQHLTVLPVLTQAWLSPIRSSCAPEVAPFAGVP
jgi:hypothetical protein